MKSMRNDMNAKERRSGRERGRERSDEQANKVRTSERKTSKTKISDDKQKNNNL